MKLMAKYLDDMQCPSFNFPALANNSGNMTGQVHSALPGLEPSLVNVRRNVISGQADGWIPLIRDVIFGHELRSYIEKLAPREAECSGMG